MCIVERTIFFSMVPSFILTENGAGGHPVSFLLYFCFRVDL